jgi:hypothetical protein
MNKFASGMRALIALAVCSVLSVASMSLAQSETSDKPAAGSAAQDKKPSAPKPKTDDGAAKADKPPKEAKAAKDKKADGEDDDGSPDKQPNPKALKKRMMLEESKYRDQMARIDRLRELATEQKNEERLAALDSLEAKLTDNHERRMARIKSRLNADDVKAMDTELAKGKAPNPKARGKGPDGQGPPGQRKKEEGEQNASGIATGAKDNGKGKNKDAEADKDKTKAADKGGKDKKNKDGEQPKGKDKSENAGGKKDTPASAPAGSADSDAGADSKPDNGKGKNADKDNGKGGPKKP